MNKNISQQIIFDAANKIVGRLASSICQTLLGKNKVDYQKHILNRDTVKIININQLKFSGKKYSSKIYYHHSHYPGGLKEKLAKDMSKKDILLMAISRMLPNNRQKNLLLKKITIE